MDDLEGKYAKTFGNMRQPVSWKIYEERIKLLKDEKVQAQFQRFMSSVLNSTFSEERYRTDINLHLKHLETKCPDLLKEWKGKQLPVAVDASTQIIDTDDWQDLFLSGTDVPDSCLRVDGDSKTNQCLLAYVIDGKNRMIALKDTTSGKIIARSMFRLLWDDEQKKPLLYQEKVYPKNSNDEITLLLNQHAKKRAQELNCTLVTANTNQEDLEDYPGTAVSLGSSCPYDYNDAPEGGGVIEDGKYEISDLKVFFESSEH